MKWETVRLGDIAEFSNGINFDKSAYSDGTHLIGVSNFGSRFSPDYSTLSQVKSDIVRDGDYLRDGDIVFVRSNGNKELVGRCMLVERPPCPVTFSGFCIRTRLKETQKYDPEFFTYHFKNAEFRKAMSGTAVGANIQNLSQTRLANYYTTVPEIETQRRIADILSAYDELIENNRKQIKLLEEAAQRLYKEWFVDLRFPGYEDTKIVDGVPEGWVNTTLGEICALNKCVLTPNKIPANVPYIGLEHMPRKDICLCEWGNSSDVTSNKYAYQEQDILFGKIRPYFHKVGFALNNGVASTDSIIMRAKDGVWGLLLMTVSSEAFVDYTYQTCKEGAKMPRADWEQMKKYSVLIADSIAQKRFEDYVRSTTNRIKTLAMQNRALTEARDRLLQKLMSGEIEV